MAQELSRRTEIPYFKNEDEHKYFLTDPAYFKHAVRYVDPYFTKYLQISGASIILDRAWPSEWIYSKAFGRTTDEVALSWLDSAHADLGTVIICPYRTDYSKLEDYDSISEKIQVIDRLYEDFARWTKCKVVRFCVDDLTLSEEMNLIEATVPKLIGV